MTTWIYALVSVFLVSIFSFVGVLALSFKDKFLKKILIFFVAFSAGALIGDAFLHLLPEAIGESGFTPQVSFAVFAGIVVFFLLEKILRWRHCHNTDCEDHSRHLGQMNLVGDGVHNFIDGLLIGASFLVSVPVGIATTTAVVLHEIPQELGDFGVLLHSGFSKKKAILFNFLSACLAILGAIIALTLGTKTGYFGEAMIPFAAGGFLYIALSDLIPELHKEVKWQSAITHLLFLILGIGMMMLLLLIE